MVYIDQVSVLGGNLFQVTTGSFISYCFSLLGTYVLGLAAYRLWFHPLAKFPGPKLAAISYWYEYHWDVNPERGRYIWKIIDLHAVYGPVVRINPNEVHINDPDFFGEIYHSKNIKTDRDSWYNLEFLGAGTAFTTDHDLHNIRRQAIAPYFSMQSVRALEPRIVSIVEHMLQRLHEAYKSGTIINLRELFSAFALDIVSEYAFGKAGSTALMGKPELGRAWNEMADGQVAINNFSRQFRILLKVMIRLPPWVILKLSPGLKDNIVWRQSLLNQIDHILENIGVRSNKKEKEEEANIIHDLATGNLPAQEKERLRLRDESSLLLGAGGETTAQTLTRTCYHILSNPVVLRSLQMELKRAMPDPSDSLPSLAALQQLPYLTAVIEEGVRMAFPVLSRSPRVFQSHTLQYEEWAIPPGAAVSQSPYIVASNPVIFPEPFTFNPERWLDNKTPAKYQVAFSKGRRICLGLNLAYAELYYGIATIFRKFELELYQTTYRDVDVVHDFFIGVVSTESKGVRIRVVNELP